MCKECLKADCYSDAIHEDYKVFLKSVQTSYDDVVARDGDEFAIFRTTVPLSDHPGFKLSDIFLKHLPEDCRQHYNCNSCKHFIDKYGCLVSLDSEGKATSVFWNPELNQGVFKDIAEGLKNVVEHAKVHEPFFDNNDYLGNNERNGEYDWTHIFVKRSNSEKTTKGYIPELVSSAVILRRNLRERLLNTDEVTIKKALGILQSGKVYRSEKFIANIHWFFDLKTRYCKYHNENMLWYAVMNAPTGFANLGSNMVGWLLEEVSKCKTTLDKENIICRFNDKVSPEVYQRPTEAPSYGNIIAAEKLIEKLGLVESLKRRFAKIEEVPLLWKPQSIIDNKKSKGIFSNLVSKEEKRVNEELTGVNAYASLEPKRVSVLKFLSILNAREICKIELERKRWNTYAGVLTAVDPTNPPIIRWDIPTPFQDNNWNLVPYVVDNENGVETIRNPMSWYMYNKPTTASEWNLMAPNAYDTVTGITWLPNMFKEGANIASDLKGVFVFIDGCRDVKTDPSLGLFPEILIEECRPIRSTLEAYSAAHTPDDRLDATACGVIIQSNNIPNNIPELYTFVVTDKLGMCEKYSIVCWD